MSFRRRLPSGKAAEFVEASGRAPGSGDITKRIPNLDQWAVMKLVASGVLDQHPNLDWYRGSGDTLERG